MIAVNPRESRPNWNYSRLIIGNVVQISPGTWRNHSHCELCGEQFTGDSYNKLKALRLVQKKFREHVREDHPEKLSEMDGSNGNRSFA